MEESNYPAQPLPRLSMGQAVKSVFGKYATFKGRARRSEYWWWALAQSLMLIGGIILDQAFGTAWMGEFYGTFYLIIGLGLFVPTLAVSVRRMHDINKSGWNWLWNLIPLLGAILLIVWCCKDSDKGENDYGPSPKYVDPHEVTQL